jgi:hypothetical protein
VTATIRAARLEDAAAIADITTQLGYPVDADEQVLRLREVLYGRARRARRA